MMGVIKKPENIFPEITKDFQNLFGTDLVSIILYGSAVSGHYVPGKSDINFLVVLTEAGLNDLERCVSLVAKWRGKRVKIVFMTRNYINSSIDSYPVEFLNMKINYAVIFGSDVFEGLNFQLGNLRLQLERELKGKIFHLQNGFLEGEGREKALRHLIKLSLAAFVPLFKALLFFRGYEIPHGRRDVIKALSLAYTIEPDVFLKCIDIHEGKGKFSSAEIKKLFKSYQKEIIKLSALIDGMEV